MELGASETPAQSGEVTSLLRELRQGNPQAGDLLIPIVYNELRRIAAIQMRKERPDHSLQPTALVHEVYMRLVDQREKNWHNRAHFFGVAAHLMRLILVDYARRHRSKRHGGDKKKAPLEDVNLVSFDRSEDLISLDNVLSRLAQRDERMVRIVELRFFAGLTVEETAEVLAVSTKTVNREWATARAWLYAELTGEEHS